MKIKAIITGSTGMVGKGVLLECLDSPEVESVLVINRQPLGLSHPKLKEIIHDDFYDLTDIKDQLRDYNTCYFCLGATVVGKTEEVYHKITYDLTINFARVLTDVNTDMTFCYVSGTGTDSTEKGSTMWARIKGKTENTLLKLPFKRVYLFRPGIIQPRRGIKSKTGWYNAVYVLFIPIFPILNLLFPKNITDTSRVGKAMINAVARGVEKKYFENPDINELAAL